MSGGLFAAGWFIFIDALVIHSHLRITPSIGFAHYVPGFVATVGLFMIVVTPYRSLDPENSFMSGSAAGCARFWLFTAFTTSFVSMIIAVMIAQSMQYGTESRFSYTGVEGGGGGSGGESSHTWVGAASALQSMAIFASATCWMMAQIQRTQGSLL